MGRGLLSTRSEAWLLLLACLGRRRGQAFVRREHAPAAVATGIECTLRWYLRRYSYILQYEEYEGAFEYIRTI